uniref:Uncharacterized protein n=1 Tax=Arundo donax TaxID=35708 RepID=A0A0A8YMJ9_ARUDO
MSTLGVGTTGTGISPSTRCGAWRKRSSCAGSQSLSK